MDSEWDFKIGWDWLGAPFILCLLLGINGHHIIVFVWSQYDGGNIEQRAIGYGCRQTQKAKLKIVGGVILWSNQQEADPTSSYITSVIMSKPLVLGCKHFVIGLIECLAS